MRRQVDKQRFRNSKQQQQLHQHLGTSETQTVNPDVPGLLAGRDCDTMGQAGSKHHIAQTLAFRGKAIKETMLPRHPLCYKPIRSL